MNIIAIVAITLFPFSLVMGAGSSGSLEKTAATQYRYGMDLDIAKVISISEPRGACGLVPITMQYEDNRGDIHFLHFTQLNSAPRCPDN